jgi:hypothetical protein
VQLRVEIAGIGHNPIHLSFRYAMDLEIAATTQAWYCRNETGSSITHVLLQGTKSIMEKAADAEQR